MRFGCRNDPFIKRLQSYCFEKLNANRGRSRVQKGHRFDLGPTILTVPKVFEELLGKMWRKFLRHVKTTKLDPYYNIVFQDKTTLRVSDSMEDFETQIKKISPKDLKDIENLGFV